MRSTASATRSASVDSAQHDDDDFSCADFNETAGYGIRGIWASGVGDAAQQPARLRRATAEDPPGGSGVERGSALGLGASAAALTRGWCVRKTSA